jgi:23S rRNA pseudouridine1911/1915/1917 synthase
MSAARGREGRMEARRKAGVDLRREVRERKEAERAEKQRGSEVAEQQGSEAAGRRGSEAKQRGSVNNGSGESAEDFTGGELLVGAKENEQRLDHFLVAKLGGVSRARVQLLIGQGKVEVGTDPDASAVIDRASYRLSKGERVRVTGVAQRAPLRAIAEDIPLDIIYEDADLAIVNKPAGMMVHAGAGSTAEDERGKGTLVNALLHHLGTLSKGNPEQVHLSPTEGELRPGIVHRLDKDTSGLLVVAKNDAAHARLAAAFAERETEKEYIALVQGRMPAEKGTINAAISRDLVRRTRMTTRRNGGRSATTHWKVLERIETAAGEFTLLEVTIETGRTHQIRVHLSSVGHPVVGDTLYGAAEFVSAPDKAALDRAAKNREGQSVGKVVSTNPASKSDAIKMKAAKRRAIEANQAGGIQSEPLKLGRNFLHARRLGLPHPGTGKWMEWEAVLPEELESFIARLRRVK